jgi:hypothetical protein
MTDDQYPTYQQPEPVVEVEVIPTPAVVEPVEVVEEPVVVPEPEVVVASAPEVVEEPIAKSKNDTAPAAKNKQVVHLSALVFASNSRNSVSVGLVQDRLLELGFSDAGVDKNGWLGKGTLKSLADFAKTSVDKCNPQDSTMISKLFAGTSVEVID